MSKIKVEKFICDQCKKEVGIEEGKFAGVSPLSEWYKLKEPSGIAGVRALDFCCKECLQKYLNSDGSKN